MPKCKYCGRTIPKADKDLCRYCGSREPFDLVSSETKDITQFIDFDPTLVNQFKRKKLKVYSFLTMFLGIFAAHLFYIGKKRNGIILLISNLIFIGGAGALLMLAHFSDSFYPLYWIISFGILFLVYLIMGIVIMFKGEVVDQDGHQLN
jgi:TM2 domain-containing membrane protein YozV